MGGGQGLPGRRERPGRRAAPGAGISGPGTGSESPPPPGTSPPGTGPDRGRYQDRGEQRSGDWGDDTGRSANLDNLAPLPDRPSLYPGDSRYFLVPVTFEIELITRPDAPAPEQTADGGSRRKGVGS